MFLPNHGILAYAPRGEKTNSRTVHNNLQSSMETHHINLNHNELQYSTNTLTPQSLKLLVFVMIFLYLST